MHDKVVVQEPLELTSCDTKEPWQQTARITQDDATLTLYRLHRDVDPNLWRRFEMCLLVVTDAESWWIRASMHTQFGQDFGEFIREDLVLLRFHHITTSSSYLLHLDTRDLKRLGSGLANVQERGVNNGLIRLDQKRYFTTGGAFWIRVLVNLQGQVVEFLPATGSQRCIDVSDLLTKYGYDPAEGFRNQSDQCVFVNT